MNNKYPQITLVFDRRKTASLKTKASVEMRICYNYRQKFISTGIMLYSNQWKDGKITNCPDIFEISDTLNKMLSDVRQIIMEMYEEGNIDIKAIPAVLSKKREGVVTFLEFCRQRAEIRKYGKAPDSQERYDRFLRFFSRWGKIKTFEDVNEHNIILYDKYLASKGMRPYSKWNNYHRFLNSFIADAIDLGYLRKNPYKLIYIERGQDMSSIGKCLTPEEFRKLRETPMPNERLERTRDLFVFQTYTCLSYIDLKDFDAGKITEVKEIKVYTGKRHKTNKPYTIPLLPPALEILSKYQNKLPVISNVKYNAYLKEVARKLGIDKILSSHWARHTGATLLLNEGVDMRIVSKICGHSSTRITEQIYAKLFDESVIDALSSLDI